ncbi:MAG: DUF1491 family protein [Rhodospirillales bacterium]|nr:DUF1491 family protein [Rhodospirillales bacterium]
MSTPRLKTGLRVQALLRLAGRIGQSGAVLRRGDADSGGLLLVLRRGAQLAAFSEMRDAHGKLAWLAATGTAPVDQERIDSYVDRQIRTDPDLWVVELETADFVPPPINGA